MKSSPAIFTSISSISIVEIMLPLISPRLIWKLGIELSLCSMRFFAYMRLCSVWENRKSPTRRTKNTATSIKKMVLLRTVFRENAGSLLSVTLNDLDFPTKPIILKSGQIKTEFDWAVRKVLFTALFCLLGTFFRKKPGRAGMNLYFRDGFNIKHFCCLTSSYDMKNEATATATQRRLF